MTSLRSMSIFGDRKNDLASLVNSGGCFFSNMAICEPPFKKMRFPYIFSHDFPVAMVDSHEVSVWAWPCFGLERCQSRWDPESFQDELGLFGFTPGGPGIATAIGGEWLEGKSY